MADALAEKVIRIVAAQARLPVDAVRLEASPQETGLDSLGLVEMVFAIEEEFDIAVPFNTNATGPQDFDISSIGAVVEAVRALVAARA